MINLESNLMSAADLKKKLFSEILPGEPGIDSLVLEIVIKHLGGKRLQSKAGNKLAEELISLARRSPKEAAQL